MTEKPSGFLSLVLHCHLPFVRHPEHDYFLEENWLYEALFETYLPLLARCEEMVEKSIPFKLALSISPTLLSMWKDPLLQSRALRYADDLLELLEEEKNRIQSQRSFQPVAEMYLQRISSYREKLEKQYGGDISRGFKALQDLGHVDLITCGATHGFFPLLASRPQALRAQVETALVFHEECFGQRPKGFWLPECGYQPGLETLLKEQGVGYFFLDTHGLLHGKPRPRYGTFAPIQCPDGTEVFARDLESSREVWSSKEGYPGDPAYREFYRDLGFDLPEADLEPYLKPEGVRRFTGLKYYRVTGPGPEKEPYDPKAALLQAKAHAKDFLQKRQAQVQKVAAWMDRPPQLTFMFDAELFGHWWFEGPDFLYFLFEETKYSGSKLKWVTPGEYLQDAPTLQGLEPAASSWGEGGYSEFWLNEANDWIYPLLQKACERMEKAAQDHPLAKGLTLRALNQAARELLLAQASDWAFMMKTGHHRSYAEGRVRGHLANLDQLLEQVKGGKVWEEILEGLEEKNNLFFNLTYKIYAKPRK